jgi:5-methylcytosine-specific restriction endonuclease McrA
VDTEQAILAAAARLFAERGGRVDDDSYDHYRQEKYNDYKSYISSYDWQVKADSLKRDAGHRCQQCGKRKSRRKLHIHHKHYKTLFRERRTDVQVLCGKCHASKHSKNG